MSKTNKLLRAAVFHQNGWVRRPGKHQGPKGWTSRGEAGRISSCLSFVTSKIVIEIGALHKTYTSGWGPWKKSTPVLKGFDFIAEPGQVTGVLGPNGAGKTTLFRIISGLERPSSGQVRINGVDPWESPQAIRGTVALLPEEPGVSGYDTGQGHLYEFGIMMGLSPHEVKEALTQADGTLRLSSFWDRGFRTYSRGQKARIALARMLLMPQASVMIFDEPSNGLDFESVSRLHRFIRQQAAQGKTILVASHILADLKHLCDRLVGLSDGRAASDEELAAWLQAHEQVRGQAASHAVEPAP